MYVCVCVCSVYGRMCICMWWHSNGVVLHVPLSVDIHGHISLSIVVQVTYVGYFNSPGLSSGFMSYWFLFMFILSVMKFYKLLNNLVHLEDILEYLRLYRLEMVRFLIRRLCAGHFLDTRTCRPCAQCLKWVFPWTYNDNKKYVFLPFCSLAHSNKSDRQQLFAFGEPCCNISWWYLLRVILKFT